MFGRFAIGCIITTAIISVARIERSSGAAAAFSDDGNHVYLLGSNLPKGMVLDVDLINFTTKQLNLGVSTEVHGIVNAPRALLFVTDRSLYRLPLPTGQPGKICDAPAGCLFHDVACNRAQHGVLLMCRTKDGRDWPSYYLREQRQTPSLIATRRVNALVGAVFDREGHLFFAAEGDVWEGSVEPPPEPDLPTSVEAIRFAPVALRETANGTSGSTGARELAVAGQTVYVHMQRMGGSGWGEMISVRWPGEPKSEDEKPGVENGVKPNVETFKSALAVFRVYGPNLGASYLCGSPDGKKVFFATRNSDNAGEALRFYLGDDNGEVHPLDQLKIEEGGQLKIETGAQPERGTETKIGSPLAEEKSHEADAQKFEAAKQEYQQALPAGNEAARLTYVNKLAQIIERNVAERWKTGHPNPAYLKIAEAINSELKKHPTSKDSDSKKLSQLLVGKWQSPRHTYIFRANGKWGNEDGPVDTNWRVQGNQIVLGEGKTASRSTIILLNSEYLIYTEGDAVYFFSRVNE